MLYQNEDVVKKVYYNNYPLRKVYYNDFPVWIGAFFTKIRIKLISDTRTGTKGKHNPAWDPWKSEYDRLQNILSIKKREKNKAIKDAKATYGWQAKKDDLNKKQKEVNRLTKIYDKALEDEGKAARAANSLYDSLYAGYYAAEKEARGYQAAWDEFIAQAEAWDKWREDNPKPEERIENPEYTTWKADHKVYVDALANAQADYTVAENAYNTAKKNYDDAVTAGESSEEIARLKQIMEDAAADKASAAGAVAEAKHNKEWWEQLNPKPDLETIENPAYTEWVRQDYEWSEEGQRLLHNFKLIEEAAQAAAKQSTLSNPDYITAYHAWEEADAASDTATANLVHAERLRDDAQEVFNTADNNVNNDPAVVAATNAVNDAQADINSWKAQEPPEELVEPCTYTFYKFSASMLETPEFPQDESDTYLDIKVIINNTQPNVGEYRFKNVNRGPDIDTLSIRLDVHNRSKTTGYTNWGSMDYTYPSALATSEGSNSSLKTYLVNTDENKIIGPFGFEWRV